MNLNEEAKKNANQMYNRGLQPWHVEGELNVRAILPMYRAQLKEMVVEQLQKLQNY